MDRCQEGIGLKIHRKENVNIKRESYGGYYETGNY